MQVVVSNRHWDWGFRVWWAIYLENRRERGLDAMAEDGSWWLSSVTYVLPTLQVLVTLVGNGPRWTIFLRTYAINDNKDGY